MHMLTVLGTLSQRNISLLKKNKWKLIKDLFFEHEIVQNKTI